MGIRDLFRFLPWRPPTRPPPAARMMDAAGGDRRWRSERSVFDPVAETRGSAPLVHARVNNFILNDPTGAAIMRAVKSNIIGTGITPRSQHPSEFVRNRIHTSWTGFYCDQADAEEVSDIYGLQEGGVHDLFAYGEALFLSERKPRTGVPCWRRLNPEQLARDETRELSAGGCIAQGVEFSPSGQRVAYHIRRAVPVTGMAGLSLKPVRVPASEVIHMFQRIFAGQVRGISALASALTTARELALYVESVLVRARTGAMHAGFVYDSDGPLPYDGVQTGSTLDVSIEPGAIINMPPGKRIEFPSVPDQGPVAEMAANYYRRIAASVGIPYSQVTGDYSAANYSSERAAQMDFRRYAETIQYNVVIFQFCRPVWAKFIEWCVLSGRLPATEYQANPDAFLAVKWLPPGWGWVDPLKDTQAAVLAMQHGLRSRSEIVASLGYDIEALDREIAADTERANRLGLTLGESKND